MKTNKKIFHKKALSICIAALLSPTVMAAEDIKEIERIQVTGSNIFKGSANFTSSSPITEIGKEAIEGIGAISVGDALSNVPSVTSQMNGSSGNVSVGGGAGDVGVATAALRNLGQERTLVLVNGRRYVSGVSANNGYGVDLNSIPTAIIERVDVLTGGQSAIYGSDAVAGVINIITKKEFEGFEVNAMGSSADKGAEKTNIDFTYGKNFDAGNAWISAGFSKQDSLMSRDRDFAANELRFLDTTGDGLRDSLAVRNGPNHVDGAFLGYGDVNIFGNGDAFNTNQPLLDSNYNRIGTTDFDNQHAGRTIVTPYERFTIATGISFDISDNSSAEFEVNYASTTASTAIEEAPIDVNGNLFRTGAGGTNPIDVATSPYFVGSSAGAQLVAAMNANDGDTSLSNVRTNRRLWEFGERGVNNSRDTFRVAGSYSYILDNDMEWKTSGTYGVTNSSYVMTGETFLPHMREAVTIEPDGNGGYQCANELARIEGCIPVNPFSTEDSLAGQAGIVGFSEEAMEYIQIDASQIAKVEQTVITSVLSGELDFADMGFAVGIEYRKEEAIETPDSFRQMGLARGPAVQAIKGDFDVAEAFGELYIPVADWLNVSLAGRVADYSTVGTTFTYRLGLDAPVNDWLFLRTEVSSSVRAPNISNLFASGATSVGPTTTDACNGATDTGSSNIDVNCASIDAIAKRMAANGGVYELGGSELNNTQVKKTGSVELQEETANSFTLGAVFTPLDNVSISIDYYDIEIEDGIATVSAPIFVERCHEVAPSSFDATCGGNLTRDVNQGPILFLTTTPINADTISTNGIDLKVAYSPIDELSLNLNANFLGDYTQETVGGVEEFAGRPQFPEINLTANASYDITEDFNLFAQLTYRSETEAYLDADNGGYTEDLNTMDAVMYLDMTASYQMMDSLNVYVGANNLFDEQPDILVRGASIGTNTEPRAYDVVGRTIFAGLKLTF
ncbi:TonB-dependent receptor domain-containing protein [Thalassotalea atypica]|uniref:TonB-dependent receptor domain-containing protein n=1 Tax=Thalassotalea atypica TaxID=2054316 RepID=UPI0025748F28|nr:TonB-dependent receptor [Thalassotalea atypica]